MKTTMTLIAFALLSASALAAPAVMQFDVRHELEITVPETGGKLDVWFTLPQEDPSQAISDFTVSAPGAWKVTRDSEGNQVLYMQIEKATPGIMRVQTSFVVKRTEEVVSTDPSSVKEFTEDELSGLFARYLRANVNIVINDEIKALAREIVGSEKNPMKRARLIYDWVLANIEYWVKDPDNKKASPVGSSEYCRTSKTGNCTDFHSLYVAIARAADLPCRLKYGSLFKPELAGQDTDASYHCWIDVQMPGLGWLPLDVAVADIFVGDFELNDKNKTLVTRTTATGYTGKDQKMVDYYFGNLDARRVTWSIGRDMLLEPAPVVGRLNALTKAHVELDGKVFDGWKRKLTFRDLK